MSRTVSARISKETHEKLCEQCNKIGCSINDYLQACIELGLTGYSGFDFGDEDEIKPSENNVSDKNNIKKVVIQA